MSGKSWYVYALRCADDTLYTGVTTDPARRLSEHNAGHGARYTSPRRPVHLVGAWPFPDQSAAQRAEAAFRKLSRRQKLQRIARTLPVSGADFCQDERVRDLLSPVRFCPRCGELLRAVRRAHDDRPRHICTVCGRVDYRNAKPCAAVLVVRNGRLLLVKRAIQPYLGYWDIPGGFVEEDELPAAAASREVEEETGLTVALTGLFGFYLGRYDYGDEETHTLNTYFLGQVVGGSERPDDDAAALDWFRPADLPHAIAFEHAQRVLDDWSDWMREGGNGSWAGPAGTSSTP